MWPRQPYQDQDHKQDNRVQDQDQDDTKWKSHYLHDTEIGIEQESPAVADKPARRLRKVRTVYVRAVGL